MNREIKFRAWEPHCKIMSPVTHLDFVTEELDCEHNMGEPKMIYHFHLMQYTGLTDKNGKEIYEGDIICVCNNRNGFFQVVFVNAYVGGWVLKYDNEHDLLSLGAREQEEVEVIGNIHENPELIK